MKKLPVAAMERERMIVYITRNPELVMQHTRLLRAIKLEFEGLHAVQFLFRCASEYRRMFDLHAFHDMNTKQ